LFGLQSASDLIFNHELIGGPAGLFVRRRDQPVSAVDERHRSVACVAPPKGATSVRPSAPPLRRTRHERLPAQPAL